MTDKNFYILILATTVVLFLIGIYMIYMYTGWVPFTMNTNENFLIDASPTDAAKIKFKNCIYTITNPSITNGVNSYTRDVTSQLNLMISAYKTNTKNDYVFKLDSGLSQYSFIIKDFSDYKSLESYNIPLGPPDPVTGNQSYDFPPEWKTKDVKATLVGYYK